MIRQIELTNFQSHKHSVIQFDKGVNAIVGLSDSGKSAILRALIWAVTNKPSGDSFISSWATGKGDLTEVKIQLEDGSSVTRGRSKSDNYYKVTTGSECLEFRAFGQDVPVEVKEVFNLNDINLQAQMDSPFLLASPPGEVAQILNKVVNLDVIDRATSAIRKEKMAADGSLRREEARLTELETEIRQYDYLINMEKDIEHWISQEALVKEKQHCLHELKNMVGKAKILDSRGVEAQKVLAAEKAVSAIDSQILKVQKKEERLKTIKECLFTGKALQGKLQSSLSYQGAPEIIDECVSLINKKNTHEKLVAAIDKLLEQICRCDEIIEKSIDTISNLERTLPETCPLCGK